jgi:hypothetical protein
MIVAVAVVVRVVVTVGAVVVVVVVVPAVVLEVRVIMFNFVGIKTTVFRNFNAT